jgi:hypothetical protein
MRVGLCNILIEFGIPMKLVRLIKMFLNETCSTVRVSKHFSDMFPNKIGLKKKYMLYYHLLFKFAVGYAILRFQVS